MNSLLVALRRLLSPRSPPSPAGPPQRYPLAESLRAELFQTIEQLETAGMLAPGEVSREELVACAEREDEFEEMDIVMVANILSMVGEARAAPFERLAFFPDQVETTDDDALAIVRELARLAGQGDSVRGLRLRMTGALARRGEFPPPNAVVEFELGTQAHALPFIMYSKNAPIGLTEEVALIFTQAADPRRFFEAGFDTFSIVTYAIPEKIAALNAALAPEPTWFEVPPTEANPE